MQVTEDLNNEYRGRPAWPKTPDEYFHISDHPDDRKWSEPRSDEPDSIFAPSEMHRLRIVGMGPFSATAFPLEGLSLLMPSEAIILTEGSAMRDPKALTIRTGSAESYSLSLSKVLARLIVEERGQDGETLIFPRPPGDLQCHTRATNKRTP